MLALSTGCLYKYGLNRIFEIAKELEFDAIEVVTNEICDTHDAKYLEKLIQTFDMPISVIKVNNKVNTPNKVRDILHIAEHLNIPIMTIRVPYFTDFKFTRWFKTYVPRMQDKTDVKIAVENAPSGKGFLLPEYAFRDLKDLKKFKHICLDTSHLVSRNTDLIRAYEATKKHLAMVHLSNWYKNNEHWMLDEGMLPLESFLTKLAKDRFTGPITLKLDIKHIGDDNLKNIVKNLKKAQDFYKEYFLDNLEK